MAAFGLFPLAAPIFLPLDAWYLKTQHSEPVLAFVTGVTRYIYHIVYTYPPLISFSV